MDIRRVRALCVVFIGSLLCIAAISRGDAGAVMANIPFAPSSEPVTVWHIPHPDDETLGMAGAMMAERDHGRRNIVVFYSDGGASDARHVINGLFYCPWHQRFHDPKAEGYEVLSVSEFSRARLAEATAALNVLGVSEEDIFSAGFIDGELEVHRVYDMMRAIDSVFSDSAHRTTSMADTHRDHRTLARALYRLYEEKVKTGTNVDVAFYGVYPYTRSIHRRGEGMVRQEVPDMTLKRAALAEFSEWDPSEGRYAVGMHSVPHLFKHAEQDGYEYKDKLPSVVMAKHVRAYETTVSVFRERLAFSAPLTQRVSLRLDVMYNGQMVSPALVYRLPTLSGNVALYVGMAWTNEATVPIVLEVAGVQLVDRLLIELGVGSKDRIGSNLRIGWKFRL